MNLEKIKNKLNKIKRTHFGICIPDLRKFAQKIAKNGYKEFIKNNDFSSFELKLFHAFLIGYIKDDICILLKYFHDFIPQVDDWCINDSLCQNFKITRKYPKEVWEFILSFKNTSKEFESRIVSVLLLSHYLNDEYIDEVIQILDKLNTDAYYSQMGVAWAIATIMGKYPDKCLNYLQSSECHLDKTTYNKSLQKIRESFKVSKEIKEFVIKLKKI